VLPNDETLAYLPTQAVAAYMTSVMGLDGLIYSSTQIGAEGESAGEPLARLLCNVVLFDSAAVVEQTPAPPRPPEPGPIAEEPIDFTWFSLPALGGADAGKSEHANPLGATDAPSSAGGAVPDIVNGAGAPARTGKSLIPAPDGLGEDGRPAALRIKRDPALVRIRAVHVETSEVFAHLYDDGRVIVGGLAVDEE